MQLCQPCSVLRMGKMYAAFRELIVAQKNRHFLQKQCSFLTLCRVDYIIQGGTPRRLV